MDSVFIIVSINYWKDKNGHKTIFKNAHFTNQAAKEYLDSKKVNDSDYKQSEWENNKRIVDYDGAVVHFEIIELQLHKQ